MRSNIQRGIRNEKGEKMRENNGAYMDYVGFSGSARVRDVDLSGFGLQRNQRTLYSGISGDCPKLRQSSQRHSFQISGRRIFGHQRILRGREKKWRYSGFYQR